MGNEQCRKIANRWGVELMLGALDKGTVSVMSATSNQNGEALPLQAIG